MTHEDTLRIVEQLWDREVEAGCGWTVPALGLTREVVNEGVAGRRDELPGIDDRMEPRWVLEGAEGKDVLCLASGGGQQSAVFGLLGARVTVLDLCEGQLRGDRAAAEHHGYHIRTIKGDACDLSAFQNGSFDIVYQAPGISWIPDLQALYSEVHRVLRSGAAYRLTVPNPAVHLAQWDGIGYRIVDRYRGGRVLKNAAGVENMEEGDFTGDHRHLLRDSVGCLVDLGFVIRYFTEDSVHFKEPVTGESGSWTHMQHFLGWGIDVVARKAEVADCDTERKEVPK